MKSNRPPDLNGTGPLEFQKELGVTPDELVKLNIRCPNIVRLGFELQGMRVAAAVSPSYEVMFGKESHIYSTFYLSFLSLTFH